MDLSDYTPTSDLSHARTIPGRWYTDAAILEAERDKIFWRTWQPVAHAAAVAEPSSYTSAEILGEPIAIARDKQGMLRAFSNVCRHRAASIINGSGKGAALRCPYHGWTYALDGRLLSTPEFEGVEEFDKANVCLPPIRCEVWGPYVFVNLDANAVPLAEVLGEIPPEIARLGCPIENMAFSERRDYEIGCNWKVYVDNYLEGYHLPSAHPSLFRELDYAQYRVNTFRYYSSQFAPIRAKAADPKTGSAKTPRRYEFGDANQGALYFWIFPNLMLNVYPDNMSANIILPIGHGRTLTIFEWFGYAGSAVAPDTIAFSDEIQQEDIGICEAVQRGLQSRTYSQGRFSVKRENGVHHFHLLLHEFLSR